MPQKIKTIILSLLSLIIIGCGRAPMKWFVYYGEHLTAQDLNKMDLAIVEPEHTHPREFPEKFWKKPLWVAYLSVGEVNQSRSYWEELKKNKTLLNENSQWPGAYAVDIRSEVWRKKILEEIIPSFLKQGFQGVFLDTIDVPLEQSRLSQDPSSREALISLIKQMKEMFPHLQIFPNNGLELLPYIGEMIAGVVVEDLYTSYDFIQKTSKATSLNDTQSKEKMLDGFREKWGKPVLNILYEESAESSLAKESIRRSQEKGYQWYLTTLELTTLGTTP